MVFASAREGPGWNLFRKAVDGSGFAERLTTSPLIQAPVDWSADGELLVVVEVDPETSMDIGVLHLDDTSAAVQRIVQTPSREWEPAISPDGRWMAYESMESGEKAIYVQPFGGADGGRRLIGAGAEPGWGPDGRELFYRSSEGFISVEVNLGATFERSRATTLFPTFTTSAPVARGMFPPTGSVSS